MARSNTLEIVINATDNASSILSGILGKTEKGVSSLGNGMMRAGAVMTASTAPLIAGLVSSVQSAAQFEQSMTNVQAVLGNTDTEMAGMNAQILAMGANSLAGPQATALAFYDIVGGVADASTHMAILEAAMATAEAGGADLGSTTSALIAVMNSYGLSAEEASMVSDVLTQTVGKGVGSMEDFAGAFPQITGLANTLDISFADLGAAMAFMTTKGFSASEASTQLKAMMTSMINPNADMASAIAETGYASGEAMVAELGLAGAYQLLGEESATFQDNMAGAVGSVEALNGVISLTDEGFNEFADSFVEGSEGATDAARAIQLDSLASQTALLKSNMEALKITIGSALIPVITRFVRAAQPVIQSIITWVQENPKLVSQVALVVGAVAGLGTGLAVLGGILSTVAGGFALLLSPIGLIIAAFVAFGVAYKTNFMGFGDFIDGLVQDIRGFADEIINAFSDDGLAGVGQLLLDKISSGLSDLPGWVIENIVTPIINTITTTDWGLVANTAIDILEQIASGFMDIGSWVGINIIYPLIDRLMNADWGSIANTALDVLAGIATGFMAINQWVFDHVTTPIANTLINADWSSIAQTGLDILSKIDEAWADMNGWIGEHIMTPIADAIIAQVTTIYESALQIGNNILSGIIDALANMASSIGNTLQTGINDAIAGLHIPTPGEVISGGLSAIESGWGSLTGKALGGPVFAGTPVTVGERGREVFVPQTDGTIVPNSDLRSTSSRSSGNVVESGSSFDLRGANINLPNVTNGRQFFDEIEREAKRRNRKLASNAFGVN